MCSQSQGVCACEGGIAPCTCGCSDEPIKKASVFKVYQPLISVLVSIGAVTVLFAAVDQMSLEQGMSVFMGIFFLVFGGLQLSNIREYVPSLARYHWLVQKVPVIGFIVPPLELLLSLVFFYDAFAAPPFLLATSRHADHAIAGYAPSALHSSPLLIIACVLTLLITLLDGIFVIRSLQKGFRPTCACLGVVLAVPLSALTVFEDVLMVAMAAYMLFLII